MEAGKNSGQTVELDILMYVGHHVPCPLEDLIAYLDQSIGIFVSVIFVTNILETHDYRIANEGGNLIIEKVVPEAPAE